MAPAKFAPHTVDTPDFPGCRYAAGANALAGARNFHARHGRVGRRVLDNLGNPSATISATLLAMVEQAAVTALTKQAVETSFRRYVVPAVGVACATAGLLGALVVGTESTKLWLLGESLSLETFARVGRPLFLFYYALNLFPAHWNGWVGRNLSLHRPACKSAMLGFALIMNNDLGVLWPVAWFAGLPNIISVAGISLVIAAAILAIRQRSGLVVGHVGLGTSSKL